MSCIEEMTQRDADVPTEPQNLVLDLVLHQIIQGIISPSVAELEMKCRKRKKQTYVHALLIDKFADGMV